MKETVERALAQSRAGAEPPVPAREQGPPALLGRTAPMLAVYKQIAHAADAANPVLIVGESGTGKELVARAIHAHGRRAARAFVPVNCGAIAESLLESELFGHVRGSFTGAVSDTKGIFEQAHGGTVFLDEMGETSPALQVKLLRVLEEGEIRPVGAGRPTRVDVRVVAATNVDLEKEVAEQRFRQDLYLPPERDRHPGAGAPRAPGRHPAARRAVPRQRVRAGRAPCGTGAGGPRRPGRVRLAGQRPRIGEHRGAAGALQPRERGGRRGPPAGVPRRGARRAASGCSRACPLLEELERRYLLHVLESVGGNRTRAAEVMGIDRRTLYRMAERFGIDLKEE